MRLVRYVPLFGFILFLLLMFYLIVRGTNPFWSVVLGLFGLSGPLSWRDIVLLGVLLISICALAWWILVGSRRAVQGKNSGYPATGTPPENPEATFEADYPKTRGRSPLARIPAAAYLPVILCLALPTVLGLIFLTGSPSLTEISGGDSHVCGLKPDGSPVCWGFGISDYKPKPMDGEHHPPENKKFTAISSGHSHTCAIRLDGSPICWGSDRYDQVSAAPEEERFIAISSGFSHACALRPDGSPVCWGDNDDHQSQPPPGEKFTAISSGGNHTCALRTDGSPVCWGNRIRRLLETYYYGQEKPPAGEKFTAISSGWTHTCALRPDGSPVCWGNDENGISTPPQNHSLAAISAGAIHTCALTTDGSAICWGDKKDRRYYGQADPPEGKKFVAISSGGDHTCGLQPDGSPVCWGSYNRGH